MAVIAIKRLDLIPVRFNLWVMIFTCCWILYMLRVNMSMSIIAMVPQPDKHNSTLRALLDSKPSSGAESNISVHHVDISDVRAAPRLTEGDGTFNWTADQQALILGSYFWIYPITSLVGGVTAERFGPRIVIFLASVASAVLTILSPVASRFDYIALVVVRALIGCAAGFMYPALHVLIAQWAPPDEKGKFISSTMGGTLGTVVTWSIMGPLMEKYKWPSAFYLPGVVALLWCGLWWYVVADTPAQHPRIKETEKKYITEALGDKVSKTKGLPPFKHIFTSIPFIAMIVLHFGNLWGLYFVMTVGPKFVSNVLGFELSTAGAVSALPYLARLFMAGIFGVIGDCIVSRKLMKTVTVRKFFSLFSHVIPGLFLILLVYVGSTAAVSVALITASMGFNGAAALTNLQNHQDLAPNYAGTLYGIANFVGSTAGFFTPMITAYFIEDGDGFDEWRPVFFVGASVYIVTAVCFILFGSANVQSWNYPDGNRADLEAENVKNNQSRDIKETPLTMEPRK